MMAISIYTYVQALIQISRIGKKENYNSYQILNKNKFKHKGFNKNFENNQPRYTFRLNINKSIEEVYK